MKTINEMEITFKAISINEGFARACISAFCVQANPSIDEITDIKTAVSEAVTNAVVHAYPLGDGNITIRVKLYPSGVVIEVADSGIGIENIEQAREPFFTTKPTEERSGMGFTVMESFMDAVSIQKNGKTGVLVKMEKIFKNTESDVVGM